MSLISRSVKKSFGMPPNQVLKGLSFEIANGDFLCISGRSGSGKSTLLYIISTLDNPSQGEVEIDGHLVTSMTEKEVHAFRNQNMGFVFQFHYLLPELTSLENVLMPAYKCQRVLERTDYAKQLLERFGMADKLHRHPHELSGGEQQRVAIARALVMQPRYLFADEPTGNLDTSNADTVFQIFQDINKQDRTTIIYVTHDPDYAALATKQLHLVDGQLDESRST